MSEHEYEDQHRLAGAGVVVGVDGSPGSELALHWAAEFALRRGRELQIVHGLDLAATTVAGPYAVITPAVIDSVRENGQRLVRSAVQNVRAEYPDLRMAAYMSSDSAAAILIDHSERAYAVVLGATGNHGTLAHLGSTLLAVTSHAAGSVIVVRPDPEADNTIHDSGPVVVGIDGGPVSEPAIAAAFAEASERGADLVALHVWNDWSAGMFAGDKSANMPEDCEVTEESVLAERLAGWQEKYPDVTVHRRLYFSAPAAQLREWSKHAQLLVVGNRGRGGFLGLLLGSTTHSLVQHAHCPVMVVHSAE
ncbi:universal stress protein [Nocardia niigatensis]